MEYPKKIMTLKELVSMGYKKEELLTIYRRRNNGIAWKTGTGGKTSTILFSTDDLEKYRRARCTGI